jgi:hypothetical protein
MTNPFDHAVEKARQCAPDPAALLRAVAACAVLLVAGCAANPIPRGSRFVVSTPIAEFYKNGPAQDVTFAQHTFDNFITEQQIGPDFQLPKGAHVTMLKPEYGFSRVVTDDGVVGYVANDKLQPAPAVARVAPTAVPNERSFRERVRANPRSRKIEEPPLDMNDLPLPLPG